MGKKKVMRVINNRMHFKCTSCMAKRSLPVQPNIRIKNIRCHKCGTVTSCLLDRRITRRWRQSGKAIMITEQGSGIAVNIYDISMNGGFGVDLPIGTARVGNVKVGDNVHFDCKWNPRLLGRGSFKVVTCNGQRIGIQKVV